MLKIETKISLLNLGHAILGLGVLLVGISVLELLLLLLLLLRGLLGLVELTVGRLGIVGELCRHVGLLLLRELRSVHLLLLLVLRHHVLHLLWLRRLMGRLGLLACHLSWESLLVG